MSTTTTRARRPSTSHEHEPVETSSSSTPPPPPPPPSSTTKRPSPGVRFRSTDDVRVVERHEDALAADETHLGLRNTIPSEGIPSRTPADTESPLPGRSSIMYRLAVVVLLLTASVPFVHSTALFGRASLPLQPVAGGPLPRAASERESSALDRRADSPTDVCFRWAQQCMSPRS